MVRIIQTFEKKRAPSLQDWARFDTFSRNGSIPLDREHPVAEFVGSGTDLIFLQGVRTARTGPKTTHGGIQIQRDFRLRLQFIRVKRIFHDFTWNVRSIELEQAFVSLELQTMAGFVCEGQPACFTVMPILLRNDVREVLFGNR